MKWNVLAMKSGTKEYVKVGEVKAPFYSEANIKAHEKESAGELNMDFYWTTLEVVMQCKCGASMTHFHGVDPCCGGMMCCPDANK
jgi:hypothetical protein